MPTPQLPTPQQIQDESSVRNELMAADIKLMNDLNDFNAKYAKYISCNTSTGAPSTCTVEDRAVTTLRASETVINADLEKIKTLVSSKKGSAIISPSLYESNHQNIKSVENDVNNIRKELDQKLKEVYKLNNTNLTDSIAQYDSVMYTGIFFTVLVTTAIYFTFTKL
jgi:hypothetical protein